MAVEQPRAITGFAESTATTVAQIAAAVVLVLGLILVVGPAVRYGGTIWANPFQPRTVTQTVTTQLPSGGRRTQTTTREASEPFIERTLAPSGLFLFRIALVAIAAFLAGAVMQRTLLGRFAMKVGPVEVPDLRQAAAASEEALAQVIGELERQKKATESAMQVAADSAEGLAALAAETKQMRETIKAFAELFGDKRPKGPPR
jgi:hypothetical protein